jgi:AraC-like DNA-binding protein
MRAAVQVTESRVGEIHFELASRPIPAALTAYLRSWSGYSERTPQVLRRRELPGPQVVVIIEFGPPISVFERGEGRSARFPGGFVAGLDDTYSMTEHDGYQAGIQLNLSPLGARTLFTLPQHELAGTVLSLRDLLPRDQHSLADRLACAASWDVRFAVIEELLYDAIRSRDASRRPAVWAAQQIEAAGGALEIGALCVELGYSHKHVLTLFREDIGMSPKQYACLVRFNALIRQLRAAPQNSWAELALDLGYADQSHLVREVRRFSGIAPRELARLVVGYPTLSSSPNCCTEVA